MLSFLDTAYYDHVLREKETYDSYSIELVAEKHGMIVGLIDVELEKEVGEKAEEEAMRYTELNDLKFGREMMYGLRSGTKRKNL
ncbi:hypothetical protein [Paenibacillus oceani]|uniref:Uncharacterized protein n=1 Tax=Paenibacillus oceani TaxID=2772510 RepID=A0A927CCE5_9BACL|nr:hypothetical protein [Paenibacillus oceani]MBD2864879.1 hypothetical protein [Paenibacillus oceani]